MSEGICWAAYIKDVDAVKKHLQDGDDIESVDRDGRTPLLNSVSGKDIRIDLPEFLIKSGSNVNAQDKAGFSSLHFCAQEKQAHIAQLLLTNGANVNIKDQWGNTPLFRALGNTDENARLIELFVENGADPYSKNESGISVIDHVLKLKSHPNHEYFKRYHETRS